MSACDSTWLIVALIVLQLVVLATLFYIIRQMKRPMAFWMMVETPPEDPKEPWQT